MDLGSVISASLWDGFIHSRHTGNSSLPLTRVPEWHFAWILCPLSYRLVESFSFEILYIFQLALCSSALVDIKWGLVALVALWLLALHVGKPFTRSLVCDWLIEYGIVESWKLDGWLVGQIFMASFLLSKVKLLKQLSIVVLLSLILLLLLLEFMLEL